jgi:ribosomal protein S18 acetylase RimI-like enzyme
MRLHEISDERLQDYLRRAGKRVDSRMERMARARERLSKGYEIYHADRPGNGTAIVDRFEADTPALARQYYEKFITRYESDVDFDLRLRRSTGIMEDKRQQLDFDSLYGKAFKITDNNGNPNNPGFSIVTPLNGASWNWKERPEFKKIVKQKLNNPGFLGDHKYQQIVDAMAGNKFDPKKHLVKEIARIPQGDFGDADTLVAPKHDVEKKELPGGSGFTYAVDKTGTGNLEIMIFDGDTLAAELDLFETQDVTNAWRVETVAVNPEYRSRGLGKALYGIALSILRLTVEAGDTQTKHGQRMWLMLNSIPGVEVMGYNMERTEKYKPRPSDEIVAQDDTWTRYLFPVRPGTNSMRSGRRGTGMYTSQASMIAKWTGQ